jgi:hypothetical protein
MSVKWRITTAWNILHLMLVTVSSNLLFRSLQPSIVGFQLCITPLLDDDSLLPSHLIPVIPYTSQHSLKKMEQRNAVLLREKYLVMEILIFVSGRNKDCRRPKSVHFVLNLSFVRSAVQSEEELEDHKYNCWRNMHFERIR